MSTDPHLLELAACSARLGADPLLTQGAGGNTSVKEGNTLYVKASGKKLASAESESVFVRVSIDPIAMASLRGESPEVFVDEGGSGLRGSIETPFHALIPNRLVVHLHSVRVIAHAVRHDGHEILKEKLSGLRWSWIPYAKPGWPLTKLIEATLSSTPEIWILQNHGVIVAAENVKAAENLLAQVEARLELPTRSTTGRASSSAGAEVLQAPSGWRLPNRKDVQNLAFDRVLFDWFRCGILTPDQAVFLGAAIGTDLTATAPSVTIAAEFERGVFLRESAPPAADDLLGCVYDVLIRTEDGAPLRYLGPEEIRELLNWDAEKYRQALNA
jgi:rhamnose utilization protein RhaD (predicted bifunctional aldolase and dehydrogenase)